MSATYGWLTPAVVNKDAKYSVVYSGGDAMQIRLVYRLNYSEKELLTTDQHDDLVKLVNAVKEEHVGYPGGSFYINEYSHVLVPAAGDYYFAGIYEPYLEFQFEGDVIGPRAPAGIEPGDPWPGPHVGIPYVLAAGGKDIKCRIQVTPTRIRALRIWAGCDGVEGGSTGRGTGARRIGGSYTFEPPEPLWRPTLRACARSLSDCPTSPSSASRIGPAIRSVCTSRPSLKSRAAQAAGPGRGSRTGRRSSWSTCQRSGGRPCWCGASAAGAAPSPPARWDLDRDRRPDRTGARGDDRPGGPLGDHAGRPRGPHRRRRGPRTGL